MHINFLYRIILSHDYPVISLKFVDQIDLFVWKKLCGNLKKIKLLRKLHCILISEMWQIKKKNLQINMENKLCPLAN